MSLIIRQPTLCIGKNKAADQLCSYWEADQHLCFCYTDSQIPLHLKSEISSFILFSSAVQPELCQTWSGTQIVVFSCEGSYKHCSSSLFTCSLIFICFCLSYQYQCTFLSQLTANALLDSGEKQNFHNQIFTKEICWM